VPTVLTLHDMWTFTGHCAHALDCGRWRTGCGSCPDLHLDPAVRRDATAANWRRKQDIYGRSRLLVATPSEWLMTQVRESILAPAITEARVIPNGVDLSVFHPGDPAAARRALDLPDEAFVVLLTTGSRGSMWKDDYTLRRMIRTVAAETGGRRPFFVALGRETSLPPDAGAWMRAVPFQTNPQVIAGYCRAADVYVHASRADTAPLAVLEALACGTPVVATRVGGIPEQIRSVDMAAIAAGPAAVGDGTGVLVPMRDPAAMAAAVDALRRHPDARRAMGLNAAADAAARFSLDRQVDAYLSWYSEILGAASRKARS
jgi:glycosyltransferase involved in cell wall biosynthesis